MNEPPPFNLSRYMLIWLGLFGLAMIVQISTAAFGIYPVGPSEGVVPFTYMFSSALLLMRAGYIGYTRLMEHLKTYHRAQWEEITYIPGLGSGNQNDFRVLSFLDEDDLKLNDPVLACLKRSFRRFQTFKWVVFGSILLILLSEFATAAYVRNLP